MTSLTGQPAGEEDKVIINYLHLNVHTVSEPLEGSKLLFGDGESNDVLQRPTKRFGANGVCAF